MADTATLRIAIVTPWFGPNLTGGAERTAWQVALGLSGRGHEVEVFTTCARSFDSDWGSDAYRPGLREESGLRVRRFSVDRRDREAFNHANDVLLGRPLSYYRSGVAAFEPSVADDFIASGINSSDAIEALRRESTSFDGVVILPYPYGLSVAAVEAVSERAMLLPCLHDESYAYLPSVERAFRGAASILFNSLGERQLAYRLYGPALALKAFLVGQWVERRPPSALPNAVHGFRPADRRYVLYLGRRDATKNVDLLVESFATFRRNDRISQLELVLIGAGTRSFGDPRHGIHDLGHVDEAAKAALLAGASAIAQPSLNESFSRAVMEGWHAGKPVVVNGRCAATADAVLESGGGWTAVTKADWTAAFGRIDQLSASVRDAMGTRGRRYVDEQTGRENVLDRYEEAIYATRDRRRGTHFDIPPAPQLAQRLSDGRRTVVFAGPLVESSCIEELLSAFAFMLSFGVDARLLLVGAFDPGEGLADRFFELVRRANLTERVLMIDSSKRDVTAACYRSANLFWSTSEDGPVAELLDALGYGVPVLAFANPTTRQLMEKSGLLFTDKSDLRAVAGVAALLLTDDALRDTVLEGQRRRFESLHTLGELERSA